MKALKFQRFRHIRLIEGLIWVGMKFFKSKNSLYKAVLIINRIHITFAIAASILYGYDQFLTGDKNPAGNIVGLLDLVHEVSDILSGSDIFTGDIPQCVAGLYDHGLIDGHGRSVDFGRSVYNAETHTDDYGYDADEQSEPELGCYSVFPDDHIGHVIACFLYISKTNICSFLEYIRKYVLCQRKNEQKFENIIWLAGALLFAYLFVESVDESREAASLPEADSEDYRSEDQYPPCPDGIPVPVHMTDQDASGHRRHPSKERQ